VQLQFVKEYCLASRRAGRQPDISGQGEMRVLVCPQQK